MFFLLIYAFDVLNHEYKNVMNLKGINFLKKKIKTVKGMNE
jgi:hypothetical protein